MIGGAAIRAGAGRTWLIYGAMAAFWAASVVAGLCIGALDVPVQDVLRALIDRDQVSAAFAAVVLDIRLPRILLGSLTGAALAVAGASLQGVVRNPLADPGLIGVSSGAALGAVLAIAGGIATLPGLAALSGSLVIAVSAFAGALVASVVTLRLATEDGRTSVMTLLLAGIAINAGAAAVIGYFMYAADNEQLRNITLWTLGSLAGGSTETNLTAGVVVLVGLVVLFRDRDRLDLMLLGEAEAFHVGVNVESLKRRVVLLSALMVGAVVAFSGLIGFVGLVVPHICRLLLGPSHRTLLPASAFLGAGLLAFADIGARTLAAPAELPIGVLTAALGTPFFLGLLIAAQRRGGLP